MADPAATLARWASSGRHVVHEADTKALLAAAGIPLPARDPSKGLCAVKLASDRFPHKTEHGLVKLGVAAGDAASVARDLAARDPDGVAIVEEMVTDGVAEWIVGCRHDPTFGPIVVMGAGGILVELLDEAAVRLAPTTPETARAAIISQKAAGILAGLRGKPAGDLDALVATVSRLSAFFADHADLIQEIELNPVIVRPAGQGAVAADALMILRQ